LFSWIIGRKSALYQVVVLPVLRPAAQLLRQRPLERKKNGDLPVTSKLVVRMAGVAFGLAALTPFAHADDGAWRVGGSYVIRFEHLDLSQPADRQALLVQIERAAGKLCNGVRTQTRRQACTADAIQKSLSAVPAPIQKAVQTARLERDGQQQARR
jgi:UrcA family protein